MAETPNPEIPNTVRERLAAMQAAGDVHPDANQLAAFVERKLAGDERAQVLAHLGVCTDCREVVALAQPAEAEPEPGPVSEVERSRWLRWEHLQWGALAAVLLVGAAVLLRSPMMRRDMPPEVQVAQSEAPVPAQPARQQEAGKPGEVSVDGVAVNGRMESQVAGEQAKLADLRDQEADRVAPAEPQRRAVEEAARSALSREMKDDSDQFRQRAASAPATGQEGAVGRGMVGGLGAGSAGGVGTGARAPTGVVGGALSSQTAPQAPPAAAPRDKSEVAQSAANEVVSVESRADRPSADEKEAGAKPKEGTAYQPPAVLPMKKHKAAGNVANYEVSAKTAAARWSVSSLGRLQRSLDGGRTWQNIPMPGRITSCTDAGRVCREATLDEVYRFRAVASVGSEVWAGGSPGDLVFHSPDSGQTWEPQQLFRKVGADVAHDVVRIDFRDAQHGTLETSARETWVTADGGETWKRK